MVLKKGQIYHLMVNMVALLNYTKCSFSRPWGWRDGDLNPIPYPFGRRSGGWSRPGDHPAVLLKERETPREQGGGIVVQVGPLDRRAHQTITTNPQARNRRKEVREWLGGLFSANIYTSARPLRGLRGRVDGRRSADRGDGRAFYLARQRPASRGDEIRRSWRPLSVLCTRGGHPAQPEGEVESHHCRKRHGCFHSGRAISIP